MNIDPLAVTVSDAIRVVGIGRTSFYAAISSGKIRIKKYGRRTLVEMDSLRAFVDALPSGAKALDSVKEAVNTSAANTVDAAATCIVGEGDKT